MTIIVKSTDEDTISLPSSILKSLRLQEGDEVKAVLEGETLRLSKLEDFLDLRGVLADDTEFDLALETLDKNWRAWTISTSV
jgi:antitoxin component of MazEF toxin-antitoxin module